MAIQKLRNQKQELAREARKMLAEKGEQKWSGDDQVKFDEIANSIESLDRQIASIERMNNLAAEEAWEDATKQATKQGGAEGDIYNRAMDIFLRKSASDRSKEEHQIIQNVMSTTTGSQGGYTVPTQIASVVIEPLKDFNGMRRVADSIRTEGGQNLNYPGSDGTSEVGELMDQNQNSNSSDVNFITVPLNVYKFGSKVITVPIELVQDTTVDLLGLLTRRIRSRIGRIQNQLFTTGSGVNQPTGLMTAAAVKRVGITGQTTTITYDDLVELTEAIDIAYFSEEMTFNMSQAMRKVIRKLKDGNGRPLWTPSYDKGIAGDGADQLMGYAININNDIAAPGASAKSLTFGAHKKYMIRDSMDLSFMRFDDSAFAKAGQVGFLAICRSGGALLDAGGIAAYQHSAT